MNNSQLFYNVFENKVAHIISCTVSPLITILSVLLAYGIIWFERFGTDQKRTIVNKFVSQSLWLAVVQVPIFMLSDILRYTIGPLPAQFCFFQVVLKNSVFTQNLCYFDAMIAARYAIIFWTKNPASINDGFWCTYVSIWIYIINITANFSRYKDYYCCRQSIKQFLHQPSI